MPSFSFRGAKSAFQFFYCRPGNRFHFVGQGAAVGVAKNQKIGTRIKSCRQGFHGIFRGILESVEKMFGVIDDFPAVVLRKSTLSAIMARFSWSVLSMMDST
jgi:hypothetical protein